MENKSSGKFESAERVGIRDKQTNEIIAVFPFKVHGSDQEIEDTIKNWFYPKASETEQHFANAYVDTLSYKELMNAKESFAD